MSVRIVRLGSPREKGEGLRLGTVRKPPRGVKKSDYAKLDYYDVWFPNLAPSLELFRWVMAEPLTPARWKTFARRYRSEMGVPNARHDIAALAALSHHADFAVGCYCEDERRCHRSVLRELLAGAGAKLA
ncbi:MAG TPA: DUF488 family protein [Nevskiaceae bacterium]|nr:DUF488 family protein [Nevskiaceae bacterium]